MNYSMNDVAMTFQAAAMIAARRQDSAEKMVLDFPDRQVVCMADLQQPLPLPDCEARAYTAACERAGLLFQLEQLETSERLSVRLCVENFTSSPVFLHSLSPLRTGAGGLALGDADSSGWMLYRQGRHKNDLPSVCTLGVSDERFADAMSSMEESGGALESAISNRFLSDQLTLLKAGRDLPQLLMLAFTTGARQMVSCSVSLDHAGRFAVLEASSLFNCYLEPGARQTGEWLEISAPLSYEPEIRRFAERKARLYQARKKDKAPSVFCTWYFYGQTVQETDCLENLRELTARSIPFDVFQIDDGWSRTLGDWRPNEKFPFGMRSLAERIREAGFIPGIWTSPFVAHESAPVCTEHPDWFLRDRAGDYCIFNVNRQDYRVLDITNPAAVAWAASIYRSLRDDGYQYHKLDFTRAAVIQDAGSYYAENIPLTEAYRNAIRQLREAMGEDAYFLMCGGLYDPLIGLVDGQRSSSDVLSMWKSTVVKGGKAAPFTTKQNLLRYWMNDWWDNDPDSLMLRRRKERFRDMNLTLGLLNEEEIKTVALNQYLGGGLVCSTEPMQEIDEDRLFVLRHLMPYIPVRPVPRDLFAGTRYPGVVDVAVRDGQWHTVAFINWSDDERQPLSVTLDSRLLGQFADKHERFVVSEFFSGVSVDAVASGQTLHLGYIEPHGAALVKIAPDCGEPVVTGSTAHFSMGGELEQLCIEHNELRFSVDHKFDCPVTYTIRLPAGYHVVGQTRQFAVFAGKVVIQVDERGPFHIRIPLGQD